MALARDIIGDVQDAQVSFIDFGIETFFTFAVVTKPHEVKLEFLFDLEREKVCMRTHFPLKC